MTRWSGLLVAGLLVACGGGGGGGSDTGGQADAPPQDALVVDIGDGDPGFVGECNPYAQTGCGAGFNCQFGEDGTASCVAAGKVATGGECGPNDGCAVGSCLDLDGIGTRCYVYCRADSDCAKGQAGHCIGLSEQAWKVCSLPEDAFKDDSCKLLKQDCKDPAQACYYTSITTVPICQAAGTAVQGGKCARPSDCSKGFACSNGACAKLCGKAADDPQCEAPLTCKTLWLASEGAKLCAQ